MCDLDPDILMFILVTTEMWELNETISVICVNVYLFYIQRQRETIRQMIDEDSCSLSLSDKYMSSRAAPSGPYARN